PFIGITSAYFFKRESKVWETHEEEQDKLTAIIQENLSGIRVVQAFAREEHEVQKFNKQNQRKLEIGIEHVDLHMKFWPFSDTLVNFQIALSLLAGAYFTLHQQITVGEFASFFTYSIMVTWPMRGVGRIVSQLGMTTVAMERISQILNAEEEDYDGEYQDLPIQGDIEFRNVYFRYKPEDKWVLEDVSFHIKAGEKVALMGQTGSGKSSIIALLCRFYEPEKGQILMDGKPLDQYARRALRQRIGLVHQKAFLFSTTIKENIAFTNTESQESLILAAAKDASVESFIHKMPKGYDTLVGEKGVTLSGGQKQRVSLARTLLSNPDILVLDDATSAVDTETEFEIQEALKQRMDGKTTILIAHRLTSVQQADWVLVLEKGKVIQMGNHQELLQEDGFYRKVYQIQVALEKDIEAELYS
ncbi:MAG: ABC transporter ATP-binding protein, partial [Bacteroidota bacterium]